MPPFSTMSPPNLPTPPIAPPIAHTQQTQIHNSQVCDPKHTHAHAHAQTAHPKVPVTFFYPNCAKENAPIGDPDPQQARCALSLSLSLLCEWSLLKTP